MLPAFQARFFPLVIFTEFQRVHELGINKPMMAAPSSNPWSPSLDLGVVDE